MEHVVKTQSPRQEKLLRSSIFGTPCLQSGEVNRVKLTIRQKKACARQAWLTEMIVGKKKRTVMPPKIPCMMTTPSARKPRIRPDLRDSPRHTHHTSITVRHH